MKGFVEKSVSVVLALAALGILGVEIHHEFFPPPPPSTRPPSVHIRDWRSMLAAARVIGNPSAPVTAIVFTDFQCPFCKRFHSALGAARAKYPDAIATAVIHLPLSGHRYADPAARVAECAGAAGHFAEAVETLYDKQDSIGTLPWSVFAVRAGVEDTLGFAKCMADTSATRRVRIGSTLAAERGFTSTPTVILNGWRYSAPPSDTELVRAIGDILSGRPPYKGFAHADLVSR